MPGKRKWDSYHELFLMAEKQGSGMVSSVGTHLTIRFPSDHPLEWELAWGVFCGHLASGRHLRPECWEFKVYGLMSFNQCVSTHVMITLNNI